LLADRLNVAQHRAEARGAPLEATELGAGPTVAADLLEVPGLGADVGEARAERKDLLNRCVEVQDVAALVVGVRVLGIHREALMGGRVEARLGVAVRRADDRIEGPVVEARVA